MYIANDKQIDAFVKAASARLLEKGVPVERVPAVLEEALRKEAAYQGLTGSDEFIRATAVDEVIRKSGVDIMKAAEVVDARINQLFQGVKK